MTLVDAHAREKGAGRTAAYRTAYRSYSRFDDLSVLRNEYAGNGHTDKKAVRRTLSRIGGEMELLRENRYIQQAQKRVAISIEQIQALH